MRKKTRQHRTESTDDIISTKEAERYCPTNTIMTAQRNMRQQGKNHLQRVQLVQDSGKHDEQLSLHFPPRVVTKRQQLVCVHIGE